MTDAIPAPPTTPRSRQNPRGARRQGGLGSIQPYNPNDNQKRHGFRGGRAERGIRGRGRGDLGQRFFMPEASLRTSDAPQFNRGLAGGPTDNNIDLERPSQSQVTQQLTGDDETTVEERELCFICASTIEHLSIAPCNHQTCHICALRLRALYKKRDCSYCKVSLISL